MTDIKMLATGLAAGILLDATVIRALLVPALVSLIRAVELVAATLASPCLEGGTVHAPQGGSAAEADDEHDFAVPQTRRSLCARRTARRSAPEGRVERADRFDLARLETLIPTAPTASSYLLPTLVD